MRNILPRGTPKEPLPQLSNIDFAVGQAATGAGVGDVTELAGGSHDQLEDTPAPAGGTISTVTSLVDPKTRSTSEDCATCLKMEISPR
jgi:hypothetical protein